MTKVIFSKTEIIDMPNGTQQFRNGQFFADVDLNKPIPLEVFGAGFSNMTHPTNAIKECITRYATSTRDITPYKYVYVLVEGKFAMLTGLQYEEAKPELEVGKIYRLKSTVGLNSRFQVGSIVTLKRIDHNDSWKYLFEIVNSNHSDWSYNNIEVELV